MKKIVLLTSLSKKGKKNKAVVAEKVASNAIGRPDATGATGAKQSYIPERISAPALGDYLDVVTMAVFQAGVSWAQIQGKWEDFRNAFAQFEPRVVAKFNRKDISRLLTTPGIVHSEKKIVATIDNTKAILELNRAFGSFQNYLRSFGSYEDLSADIQKRFRFIGEMSVYYFLFRVSEPVPPFEPWIKTIKGEHPRMREMVEHYLDFKTEKP